MQNLKERIGIENIRGMHLAGTDDLNSWCAWRKNTWLGPGMGEGVHGKSDTSGLRDWREIRKWLEEE